MERCPAFAEKTAGVGLESLLALLSRPEIVSFAVLTVVTGIAMGVLIQPDETPVRVRLPDVRPPTKILASPSLVSHLEDPSLVENPREGQSHITCYAPASGLFLGTVPSLSADDVRARIGLAQKAQVAWAQTTFSQRRKVLKSLLTWCVEDMEAIAHVCSRDTGKTLVDGAFGEILTVAEKLSWTIKHGERALKPSHRATNAMLFYKSARVEYEPLGVVSAIVSWNYPYHNILSPIISALFSGNAIVVKPSENVAWSSMLFISTVRDILTQCGHSPDLVQLVVCLPEAVEALTLDPRLNHMTFIGSEPIGQKVAVACAQAGTPVCLELGGKDPCIILDSAKIKQGAPTWMRGTFQAGGQNCIGIERFIVSSAVYDEFVNQMTERISKLKLGDVLQDSTQVDVGAIVSDRTFGHLERLISEAVQKGARLIMGGRRYRHPDHPQGHYFEPTLIVDVTPEMELAQNEVFAPIMAVFKADSIDQAVEIANGTRYGLGASVFGRQSDCDAVAKQLHCGMVSTNDFGVFYLAQSLPFGGSKSSGYGRFAGEEGLKALSHPNAVIVDRWPSLIQTSIPPPLQYPIVNGVKARDFVFGLIRTVYGGGLAAKVKGVSDILKGSL